MISGVKLSLVSILLYCYYNGVKAREEINFDFGWRFYLGDLIPCNPHAFPIDLDNVQCKGLSPNSADNSTHCREACCTNPSCAIWQFSDSDGCWMGSSNDCSAKNSSWVGGGRKLPLPPLPPPSSGPTARDYDDSSWELVDVPHDGLISENYSETEGPERQGYLPKNVTMYRKHFNLPLDWKGKSIWVYFEGIFRASTIYLNGQLLKYHDCGYTSFSVRLDTVSGVYYGDGKENENVLVVRASPVGYSGWWYEGCGIYRHVHLVAADPVHILPDSFYGASNVTGKILNHGDKNKPNKGMYTEQADFFFQADVINSKESSDAVSVIVNFILYNPDGMKMKAVSSLPVSIKPGTNTTIRAKLVASSVELWSNLHPYLHTLQAEVVSDSKILDSVNVSIGVRKADWDPKTGFYLNEVPFKWRGFNNHNDFTGVGMAVPDRVNLFRGQSMRAVGANSWRMSHNPPIPVMLSILDRLGIVVWDENREFGDNNIWVENQKDMVERDRNHPSIMIWSFCNERHCDAGSKENAVGKDFRKVSYEEDSFRPVSANMNPRSGEGLTPVLDVQGFSHRSGDEFDEFHKQYPNKPLIGSECCSCRTQRGEPFTDKKNKVFGSFNADCNQLETGYELERPFVAGCMVWTLFDYYGEPTPYLWPHVSSSFGSIDLAGFAKASAYWYRSWWLYDATNKNRSDVTYNAPMLINPGAKASEDNSAKGFMIHIVQHWDSVKGMDDNHTIQVYTNAKNVELLVNEVSKGVKEVNWLGWAEWDKIMYKPGKITANAVKMNGQSVQKILASHTRETTGVPAKLVATIDVPSENTGTGSALVLDGQDTGMVNAAIFDSKGNLVNSASNNVTFRIVSGPGKIIGVGNGDPTCHEPNKASWRSAYHGLARVIVQVTKDQASFPMHRERLRQIDSEGGIRTIVVPPGREEPLEDIVIEASVEGLGSSQVSIPVSTDAAKNGVLGVAERWFKNFNE